MVPKAGGLGWVLVFLGLAGCDRAAPDGGGAGGTHGAGAGGGQNEAGAPGEAGAPSPLAVGLHVIPPLPEHQAKASSPGATIERRSDVLYVAPDASWVVLTSGYRGVVGGTQGLRGREVFGLSPAGVVAFGLPPWDTSPDLGTFFCDLVGINRDASRLVLSTDSENIVWTRRSGFERLDGLSARIDPQVSDDSDVLVGTFRRDQGTGQYAYLAAAYTKMGGLQVLDNVPNRVNCWFNALSGDGKVALGDCGSSDPGSSTDAVAVDWSAGRGLQLLSERIGRDDCVVWGGLPSINRDASVIVGTCAAGQGFVWTASRGFATIDAPGNQTGPYPSDFTDDGSVVIGEGAFRWTQAGGAETFTPFAGHDTVTLPRRRINGTTFVTNAFGVRAMNADGSFVAGTSFDSKAVPSERTGQAFRYTPKDGMQRLESLPSDTWTWVASVSEDGSIIVGRSGHDSTSTAVFWEPNGKIHSIADALTQAGLDASARPLSSTEGAVDSRLLWGTAKGPDNDIWSWVLRLP